MIRRAKHILGIGVVCLLLAACGLGDKQEYADAIIASVDRVHDAGTASGTMTIRAAFVSGPFGDDGAGPIPAGFGGAFAPGEGDSAPDDDADGRDESRDNDRGDDESGGLLGGLPPAAVQGPPPIGVGVELDLDSGISSASFVNAAHPYGVFDDVDLYARRHNATERDARPWVHVRGDRLQKGNGGLATTEAVYFFAGFAINPAVILDLAAAPLTGSIERVGTEQIDGRATTHFEANFDLEKMMDDTREDAYPEERRDMVETLLDLLVITGTTHSGEVWIDDDGLLRRFSVVLRQNPFADLKFDLVLTLELDDIGGPVAVAVPGKRQLVSVGSVRQFLNAAVPAPDSEDFVRTVVGIASV